MSGAARRRVRLLPEDLANQIAAGEVVERPASVVKELIENALDAGARRIRVDVGHGGEEIVRVADDGHGMERGDAELAVLRHATSKIVAFDDLRAIHSFGFRGEALPSIASVSRFEMRTRRAEDQEGTLVKVVGGGVAEVGPCGCAVGTAIEVRDVFYNVPARKKFLKAVATESAKITEVVEAAALAEPGVTLILSRDGKVAGEWLRAESREERVRAAFGGETLAVCSGERGPLRVEGYLGRPERARNGAVALSIFVNGRPVRDKVLARSVALAYGSVLEPGKYPVGAVYLEMPLELVDVNVHPAKAEVRFADGRAVGDALYKIVMDGVCRAFGLPQEGGYRGRKQKIFEEPAGPGVSSWVFEGAAAPAGGLFGKGAPAAGPGVAPSPPSPLSRAPGEGEFEHSVTRDNRDGVVTSLPSAPLPSGGDQRPLPPNPPLPAGRGGQAETTPTNDTVAAAVYMAAGDGAVAVVRETEGYKVGERAVVFGALRFVAQVRNTFLICEGADGMYFLDQHAAAERVTFHRLKTGFESKGVASQKLMFPEIVRVTPSEVALVEEHGEQICKTGLDMRAAGATEVAVHAVPSVLVRASPERLAKDLLGEISHAGERAFSGAIDRAIATMACHGSVRAGDPVAPEEARALLLALDEVDFAGHCPHGRPVVMRIGWGELEHRVGRR